MQSNERKVLVVEDDYLQAQEIAYFIQGTGGEVLGPVRTMEKAVSFISQAQAAVLDIDLSGKPVFPLADLLIKRDVPIVFYTGWTGFDDLPRRFCNIPLIRKPIQDIKDAAIVALNADPIGSNDDIENILPKLRVAARLIYREPAVADRLVERLLQDAITHIKDGRGLGERDLKVRWLTERMYRIFAAHGKEFMN